jgi:hypothetical protein
MKFKKVRTEAQADVVIVVCVYGWSSGNKPLKRRTIKGCFKVRGENALWDIECGGGGLNTLADRTFAEFRDKQAKKGQQWGISECWSRSPNKPKPKAKPAPSPKAMLIKQLEHAPLNAKNDPKKAYDHILSQSGSYKFAQEVSDALSDAIELGDADFLEEALGCDFPHLREVSKVKKVLK